MTEVTVGIDIGTTSVKAIAVDGDGGVLARSRVPHRLLTPDADTFCHDADEAWRRGPRRAVSDLGVSGVGGIGIASMVPSCTAVDDEGVPTTPGLLYGDRRGRTDEAPSTTSPTSAEARAFLEWTARQRPDARGYWWAGAVAGVALGGEPVVDLGGGAQLYPLYDEHGWNAERLAAVGVRPDQLPRVVPEPGTPAGRIGGAVQAPACADAWAEALVAGADKPGDALVILGTTLIVWGTSAEYRDVPGLVSIPHVRPGLFGIGGASDAGGLFVNWAKRLLAGAPVRLDPHGVPVWAPYPRGERAPLWQPDRRASLHGLDVGHDAAAVRRAAYEASGFAARRLLELSGTAPVRIVASGGGVHDAEWLHALADSTGLPVDVVAVPEGAALGMAWYARMAAGLETSADDAVRWARTGRRVEPDPRWEGPCRERYARWCAVAG